jgi:hypothetical protein
MLTEDELKSECRLYAVEWVAALLFAAHFRQMGDDGPAFLEQARQQALAGARQKTFAGLDPAMSDLLSAEIESAVDRLLGMAKAFLAKGSSDRS